MTPVFTREEAKHHLTDLWRFFDNGETSLDRYNEIWTLSMMSLLNSSDDKNIDRGKKKLNLAFDAILLAIYDSRRLHNYDMKERMCSFFDLVELWLCKSTTINCPSFNDMNKQKGNKRKREDEERREDEDQPHSKRLKSSSTDDDEDNDPITPPSTPGKSYDEEDEDDDEVVDAEDEDDDEVVDAEDEDDDNVIIKKEPIDIPYISKKETRSVAKTNINAVIELGHTVIKEGDRDVIVINDDEDHWYSPTTPSFEPTSP